jgi:hypothetical protein
LARNTRHARPSHTAGSVLNGTTAPAAAHVSVGVPLAFKSWTTPTSAATDSARVATSGWPIEDWERIVSFITAMYRTTVTYVVSA